VLNTYRVWLRYELFRGRLSEAQFQASEAGLVDARAYHDLGRHYVIEWRRSIIRDHHIDLEEYGRDHGVLQPYEGLVE
jgi:hypothetical protein